MKNKFDFSTSVANLWIFISGINLCAAIMSFIEKDNIFAGVCFSILAILSLIMGHFDKERE